MEKHIDIDEAKKIADKLNIHAEIKKLDLISTVALLIAILSLVVACLI